MVASVFKEDAQASVKAMGLPDLPVVSLTVPSTNGLDDAELMRLAHEAEQAVIDGLTKMSDEARNRQPEQRSIKPVEELTFKGKTYQEAADNMDKFFLSHRMSDGYPVVPPTREAVNEMIAASGLPGSEIIGVMEPRKGLATVEMLAINGVMAGCRPAYMPVLVAAARAFCDPRFDMHGVMSTAGLAAPLVIISGPIVKQINLNYSFSALGPGWRANSTIGRASRLFCINIGQAWPGINDMKDAGNPAKFGMVLAENEDQTPAGWGTWRERLGFKKEDSTVSLYAAQSFRQFNDSQKNRPHKPYQKVIDPMVIRLLNSTLGTSIEQWGKDVVLDLSAGMAARWASWGYTPEKIQEEVWKRTGVPRDMLGNVPFGHFVEVKNIPEEWDNMPLDSLVPIVPTPQDIRIIVGGGNGADASLVIDRWGAGGSYTTTHKIDFPKNWDSLVKDLDDWKTPIVVK